MTEPHCPHHIGPEPCHLPAGHAGDCRPITWAELQDMCDQADDGPLFEERQKMIERWPSSAEVLAVLKERYHEEHKDTVTISYTPGFGSPRTAEEIAEILHKSIVQARDAMDVGFDEDIEPRPVAELFAPRSAVEPFNVVAVADAIAAGAHGGGDE